MGGIDASDFDTCQLILFAFIITLSNWILFIDISLVLLLASSALQILSNWLGIFTELWAPIDIKTSKQVSTVPNQ